MRVARSVSYLGSFALALSLTTPTAVRADSPLPEITYPDGSSALIVGQPLTIAWEGGNPEGPVTIDIIDVEAFQVIAGVTTESENNGSLDWVLPSNLTCGRQYQFYIQDTQPAWTYGPAFKVECEPKG